MYKVEKVPLRGYPPTFGELKVRGDEAIADWNRRLEAFRILVEQTRLLRSAVVELHHPERRRANSRTP